MTPVEGTAVGALEGAASSAPTVLAEGEQLELVHTHSPGTEVPGLEAKSAEVDSTLPISLAGADRGWVWIALFFGVLIVAMGWLGAKVGAVPSAGVAFGVALVVLRRGRLRARELGMVLVGAGLLLAALAFLDMRHAAGEQSHLGRALSGAGGGSLLGIARRKLLLEGYLLLHSPWSLTLAVCAVGLAWLWRRDRVYLFGGPAPVAAYAAFAGLVAGALAAVLCNDSGVTAAVLILLYGWAWTNWRYAPGVGR